MSQPDDNTMAPAEVSLGDVIQATTPMATDESQPLVPLNEVFRASINAEYPNLGLEPDAARRVGKFIGQMRLGGGGGIRLICGGDACEYRKACPLWQEKLQPVKIPDPDDPALFVTIIPTKAPEGQPCPLEATVVMDTRLEYSHHPDLDQSNPAHRAYLNELCLLAALEWRVNMLLAYDYHSVSQEVPAAISPSGEVYTKREMSPLLQTIQVINDRRSKIMKEMGLSREAAARVKNISQNKEDSLSKKQSAQRQLIKDKQTKDVVQIPEHVTDHTSFGQPVLSAEEAENDGKEKTVPA